MQFLIGIYVYIYNFRLSISNGKGNFSILQISLTIFPCGRDHLTNEIFPTCYIQMTSKRIESEKEIQLKLKKLFK